MKDLFSVTRSRRKKTRFYVDNELLQFYAPLLKPHGIALYCVLAKHANSETQSCFPSYETIMAQSGIGRRNTVTKYLTLLKDNGLIAIEHSEGKKPNIYYLLDVEEWSLNNIPKDTVVKLNDYIYDRNRSEYDNEPYLYNKNNRSFRGF